VSTSNSRLIAAGEGTAIIDTGTNAIVTILPTGVTRGVAVARDGNRAYATTDNGLVVIDDTQITGTVSVGYGASDIALSPDQRRAYVAVHGSVAVVDIETLSVLSTIPIPDATDDLKVAVNGKVLVIDQVYGPVRNDLQGYGSALDVASDSAGSRTFVALRDGIAEIGGNNWHPLLMNQPPGSRTVAASPDGRRVYLLDPRAPTDPAPSTLVIIDTTSAKVISTLTVPANSTTIALSADQRTAYLGSDITGPISVVRLPF
jgi:DNA-binding beta-propeller fold protein YncE